jgi:hypothetical protein
MRRHNPHVELEDFPTSDPLLANVKRLIQELYDEYADIWVGKRVINVEFNDTPLVGADYFHSDQSSIYGVTPHTVQGPEIAPTQEVNFGPPLRPGITTQLGADNAVVELTLSYPYDWAFQHGREPKEAWISKVYLSAARGAKLLQGAPDKDIDLYGVRTVLDLMSHPLDRFLVTFQESRARNGLPPLSDDEINFYIDRGWIAPKYEMDPGERFRSVETPLTELELTAAGENLEENVKPFGAKLVGAETWEPHYVPAWEYWDRFRSGTPIHIDYLQAEREHLEEYAGYDGLSVKGYIQDFIEHRGRKAFREEYPHTDKWLKRRRRAVFKGGKKVSPSAFRKARRRK